MSAAVGDDGLSASRRRLVLEGLGILVTALGFGFVYGLAARQAGFSALEIVAMSTLAFGGAAQFAAVGYVAGGLAWPGVVLLTALLNARHALYSASIAPWFAGQALPTRALIAHLLTDESYALTLAHFKRIGRTDMWGYWFAGIGMTFLPWNIASLAGVLVGGELAEPERFGIDVIFPAAMVGLAVGLISSRRELVAACGGAGIGVVAALLVGPPIGIIAGGVLGPLAGFLVPASTTGPTFLPGDQASADTAVRR